MGAKMSKKGAKVTNPQMTSTEARAARMTSTEAARAVAESRRRRWSMARPVTLGHYHTHMMKLDQIPKFPNPENSLLWKIPETITRLKITRKFWNSVSKLVKAYPKIPDTRKFPKSIPVHYKKIPETLYRFILAPKFWNFHQNYFEYSPIE